MCRNDASVVKKLTQNVAVSSIKTLSWNVLCVSPNIERGQPDIWCWKKQLRHFVFSSYLLNTSLHFKTMVACCFQFDFSLLVRNVLRFLVSNSASIDRVNLYSVHVAFGTKTTPIIYVHAMSRLQVECDAGLTPLHNVCMFVWLFSLPPILGCDCLIFMAPPKAHLFTHRLVAVNCPVDKRTILQTRL